MNNNHQVSDDAALRPETLAQYGGQDQIKESLELYILAAKMRNEPLDHTLIHGPSGTGKSTLANILANEMNMRVHFVAAPNIKTVAELTKILLELGENAILFIDEIHRLNTKLQESLYFAMEDFFVVATITDDEGFEHTNARVTIPKFTLVGATTHIGLLEEPMRNRFGINLELRPYEKDDIAKIVKAAASKLDTDITDDAAIEIAKRSRGIPRIANGFLRRIRDFAMVKNDNVINKDITLLGFRVLDIDNFGLTRADRHYMDTLLNKFGGKPVGVDTLCAALNNTKQTIEHTIEPYLLQLGFIARTSRGREVTPYGQKHFKK